MSDTQNTPDANAGRIAKTLLAYRGLRNQDLADHLGVDSGTMSKILSGARAWKMSEISSAAEFLDVSVAVFFDDHENLIRSRWISPLAAQLAAV